MRLFIKTLKYVSSDDQKTCATLMGMGLSLLCLTAQNVPTRMDYPGMLWSENDTFYVHSPNWSKVYTFTTTGRDTVDVGTDGYPGVHIKVWTIADQVIEKRIALMERRGYPQFKAFNTQLLQMMKNRDKTVYEAYGAIIEAMHEIAKKE